MEPITFMLAGAGIKAVGGVIGYLIERGAMKEAQAILEEARARYGEITPANLEAVAERYLGPSAYEQIKGDADLRDAQKAALGRMRGIVEGEGFTAEDRAALNAIQNSNAQRESAARQGILESFAARGAGGSGVELATQLQAQQGAANRNQQQGLDVAAQAQRRYYQSIRDLGGMAGQLRGQDYSEASDKARAQDAMRRFNAQTRMNAAQQDYANETNMANWQYGAARDQANMAAKRGEADADAVIGTADAIGSGVERYGLYEEQKKKGK